MVSKAVIVVLLLFSAANLVVAQTVAEDSDKKMHYCFFEEKSISIGIGSSYSLPLDLVGINVRSYYNLGEKFCLGPEVSYFKSPTTEVIEFNAIAHYIIETPVLGISPIAGVNYTIEKLEHEQEEGFGLAYGLGLHRNFGRVTVYTEYITIAGAVPDDFLNLGFMYSFKL